MAQNTEPLIDLIDHELDAQETYDINVANKAIIGHLLKFSFVTSGKVLEADTHVPNPEDPTSTVPVVAVLDEIKWNGDNTKPIYFAGRLSEKNQGLMSQAVGSKDGGSEVKASWIIYKYDSTAKKYYQRFSSDGQEIQFTVNRDMKVKVAQKPCTTIKDPENYRFEILLTARNDAGEQSLCVATSATDKEMKTFGTKVGG